MRHRLYHRPVQQQDSIVHHLVCVYRKPVPVLHTPVLHPGAAAASDLRAPDEHQRGGVVRGTPGQAGLAGIAI